MTATTAITVTATATGYAVAHDPYLIEMARTRLRGNGVVRSRIVVREGNVIHFADVVSVSLEQKRKQMLARLAERGIELPEAILIALDEYARTRADREADDAPLPDHGDLASDAAAVLAHVDPLKLVSEALRAMGYGGDLTSALLTYLAVTSRVLGMRPGSMPVHLLLVGPPSAGKSYTLFMVLRLTPPEAYHVIDAGSPRVLIYDTADLKHRVAVFSEADSLPAGEDNPAASAVRNLLQDHRLHYMATVRDPESGGFTVQDINKEGPTVLVTTAVRRLGPQLDSRLFTLDVPDDQEQLRKALLAQANIELYGASPADPALVAFQLLLQSEAPWEVTVPFAGELAIAIGRSPAAPRIARDYARLLSLVKATAVIRHAHRGRDAQGRLVATVEDYATVYALVKEVYAASVTGAGRGVRQVVEAVAAMCNSNLKPVSVTALAERLGINKMAASRRVNAALRGRWLVNAESRKGYPFVLEIGEAMSPESAGGLPDPTALGRCNTVPPQTDGYGGVISFGASEEGDTQEHDALLAGLVCDTVTPPTESVEDAVLEGVL